jgi:hypothetical protein
MRPPNNRAKLAKKLKNKAWGHPLQPYDSSGKRKRPRGTGGNKHSRHRWDWCAFGCPHREHPGKLCVGVEDQRCTCTGKASVNDVSAAPGL